MDNNLFIIYIVWIIILLLGIRFINKYKIWKPKYFLIMLVICVIYIIILYQIQILWTCFPNIDTFQNQNTTFTLYDRNTIPVEIVMDDPLQTAFGNWDGPLSWPGKNENGDRKSPNFYADDNNTDSSGKNGRSCYPGNVLQLTELVSVSAQQLHDAENAYRSLVNIQSTLNDGNIRDISSINKIIDMITKINNEVKKPAQ